MSRPTLTPRMRTNLRTAQSKANNRYLVGGRERAVPRVTLRRTKEETPCGCKEDVLDDVCRPCAEELGDLL